MEMGTESNNINSKTKGISLAIIGAFMWGIMGIFVRNLATTGYTSYDISFMRCILAGIAYFIFIAIKNPKVLKIDAKGALVCFFYGVFAYAVGFVAYGISVARIPVAVATVLMFMSPIWVALLGIVFFQEKLKKDTVMTIFVCILGASLVSNIVGVSGGGMDAMGIFAGVLNGFGVALQIMIPRYFAKQYERDTMLVYGFLGAAVALAFFSDFETISNSLANGNAVSTIMNLFGIGILCTMVANVSFVKATIYINAVTCSILSALEVVVGAAVGFVMFKENLSILQMFGGIIVVCGSLGPTICKKPPKEEIETMAP